MSSNPISFSILFNRFRWLVLGHILISIPYACLCASFICLTCTEARRIFQAALYFNTFLNTCYQVLHSYAILDSRAYLIAFLHVLH